MPQYTNLHKNARISPMKVRLVADMIRGKHVGEAEMILSMSPRRGAMFVKQGLLAAIANAEQAEADPRRLWVSEARVDEGVTIKRFKPKDRGRAHPIKKRCSHVFIAVEELVPQRA
jgi:large subunit ribosomal protein L22